MPLEAWKPIKFERRDTSGLSAVKACLDGIATPQQQKQAMEFIAERIGGVSELSYRSDGLGGERDTCFAEGRRFVGLTVLKIGVVPVERLIGETKGDQ